MSLVTFDEWMGQTMADGCVECPMCKADQAWEEAFLGPMGTNIYFRCRCCGGQWFIREGEDING